MPWFLIGCGSYASALLRMNSLRYKDIYGAYSLAVSTSFSALPSSSYISVLFSISYLNGEGLETDNFPPPPPPPGVQRPPPQPTLLPIFYELMYYYRDH